MTVYVTPVDLAAGIKAVEPHVGKDSTLPVLCTVHLRFRAGRLELTATDRYTSGRYIIDTGDQSDGPEWSALLEARDVATVKRLAAGFKGALATLAHIEFVPRDGLSLTVRTLEQSATFRTVDATFPDIDTLLRGAIGKAEGDVSGSTRSYTPDYLARFAKSAGKHDSLTVYAASGERGATLVTVGESFVGLIMSHGSAKSEIGDRVRPPALAEAA